MEKKGVSLQSRFMAELSRANFPMMVGFALCQVWLSPVLPAENGMARVPTLAQRATARTLHGRSSQASLALGDTSAGTSDTTQATSDIS